MRKALEAQPRGRPRGPRPPPQIEHPYCEKPSRPGLEAGLEVPSRAASEPQKWTTLLGIRLEAQPRGRPGGAKQNTMRPSNTDDPVRISFRGPALRPASRLHRGSFGPPTCFWGPGLPALPRWGGTVRRHRSRLHRHGKYRDHHKTHEHSTDHAHHYHEKESHVDLFHPLTLQKY